MTFENLALKTIFHFVKSFLTRNIVSSPQANICGRDSLRPPGTHFFSDPPPFKNLGLKVVPPIEREIGGGGGGGLILCGPIVKPNIGGSRQI